MNKSIGYANTVFCKKIKEYLSNIDGSKVKRAVVFSTSWLSKHSIDLIKNSTKKVIFFKKGKLIDKK